MSPSTVQGVEVERALGAPCWGGCTHLERRARHRRRGGGARGCRWVDAAGEPRRRGGGARGRGDPAVGGLAPGADRPPAAAAGSEAVRRARWRLLILGAIAVLQLRRRGGCGGLGRGLPLAGAGSRCRPRGGRLRWLRRRHGGTRFAADGLRWRLGSLAARAGRRGARRGRPRPGAAAGRRPRERSAASSSSGSGLGRSCRSSSRSSVASGPTAAGGWWRGLRRAATWERSSARS